MSGQFFYQSLKGVINDSVFNCSAVFDILSSTIFAEKKPSYEYYHLGNQVDITSTTQPGVVLMGGGTDVDAAFQWVCELSGNGDFLVIRATGTDAYNSYIQ
ncbi:hypothetical protein SAMN05421882_103415 [Nitrosomonas communis]|uniref:Uncharacterized protein n=1 Tax=Nitrosomonas communis TaxID=44574 RepID=A0A1H2X3C6_9PROT|nr:hypothetical protein SAMN05421882_103415 [Nitrosomonas communis]